MRTSYTSLLILLTFISCQRKIQHFAHESNIYHRIDNNQSQVDSAVYKIIKPYKSQLDAKMSEVIGYNSTEMVKAKPSSSLTNFIADATIAGYEKKSGKHLDAVMMNYGGIRLNSLGAGDIMVGEIFEIMPFENYLVIIQMKGNSVKQLLNKIASSGGWPISNGTGFTIQDSMATDIIIDNRAFDDSKTYTIGLPDYVANGGDDMSFLKGLPREDTGFLLRELIMLYVKDKKKIDADQSMRIKKP
jgi:2',3'-cyclic-nucleotide 2'-phosphodiesterase (5'-nucleotidase family)